MKLANKSEDDKKNIKKAQDKANCKKKQLGLAQAKHQKVLGPITAGTQTATTSSNRMGYQYTDASMGLVDV